MKNKFNFNRGFSLIEVMVVMVIMTITALAMLSFFQTQMQSTKAVRVAQEVNSTAEDIRALLSDETVCMFNFAYVPPTYNVLFDPRTPRTFTALRRKVSDSEIRDIIRAGVPINGTSLKTPLTTKAPIRLFDFKFSNSAQRLGTAVLEIPFEPLTPGSQVGPQLFLRKITLSVQMHPTQNHIIWCEAGGNNDQFWQANTHSASDGTKLTGIHYTGGPYVGVGPGMSEPQTAGLEVNGSITFTNQIIAKRPRWNSEIDIDKNIDGKAGSLRGVGAIELQSYRKLDIQVASGHNSGILSGTENTVSGHYSVIAGGRRNTIVDSLELRRDISAIVGGEDNFIDGLRSFIGAGDKNQIVSKSRNSAIGGGAVNIINASSQAGIFGGSGNIIEGASFASFIGGGRNNKIIGDGGGDGIIGRSVIVGGTGNEITTENSSIGGGRSNKIYAKVATIAGGTDNQITSKADFAFVAGRGNTADANSQVVLGSYAEIHTSFTNDNQHHPNNTVLAIGYGTSNDNRRTVMRVNGKGDIYLGSAAAVADGNIDKISIITAEGQQHLSDMRTKENIAPIEGALEKILRINGVTYNWKSKNAESKRHIGVIAQDVEKVFPETVLTEEHGFKLVNYSGLIAPIIEAVKSLYKMFQALMLQLQELLAKIDGNEEKLKAQAQELQQLRLKYLELENRMNKIEKAD